MLLANVFVDIADDQVDLLELPMAK